MTTRTAAAILTCAALLAATGCSSNFGSGSKTKQDASQLPPEVDARMDSLAQTG
ncbi:hypothetical protein [Streptomyces sp. NPDC004592]